MTESPLTTDPAGVVTHRDEFSDPGVVFNDPGQEQTIPNAQNVFTAHDSISSFHAVPTSLAPTQPIHSLHVQRIDSMISGLHGGIVIRAISLFDEPLELLVREIRSITYHPYYAERRLETVSLDEMAKKLFMVDQELPGLGFGNEREWNRYIQDSVLPVIELLESGWIGGHTNEANPVSQFFYGETGILGTATDRATVTRKLIDRASETKVPIVTKHDGPAIIIAYTV